MSEYFPVLISCSAIENLSTIIFLCDFPIQGQSNKITMSLIQNFTLWNRNGSLAIGILMLMDACSEFLFFVGDCLATCQYGNKVAKLQLYYVCTWTFQRKVG